MSMFYKSLTKLKEEAALVDLYRDFVDSESLTGIVSSYNEEFVCLSIITDAGYDNGISIIRISDITRVAWEGNERKSIQKLTTHKKTIPKNFDIKNSLTIKDIAESVQNKFGHINLLTEDIKSGMAFIGKILEIDESFLLLEGVGTFATSDISKLLLRHSEITRIDAGGIYEDDVIWLHKKLKK